MFDSVIKINLPTQEYLVTIIALDYDASDEIVAYE